MKRIIVLTAIILINSIIISQDTQEKPNRQVNNPAVYNNVMLDTGELFWIETDMRILGRSSDFAFQRTA
jgi:hypothetical protein